MGAVWPFGNRNNAAWLEIERPGRRRRTIEPLECLLEAEPARSRLRLEQRRRASEARVELAVDAAAEVPGLTKGELQVAPARDQARIQTTRTFSGVLERKKV